MLSEMGGYGITGDWMRRGWVSQPVGLGNQPTIACSNETSCANGKRTLVYLAPAGRHVYSTRDTQILKAPAGRHVYRRAICRAPAERNVLSKIGGYGITGGWMRRGWVSQPVVLGNQPTIAQDSNETSCANGKRTLWSVFSPRGAACL